MAYNPYQIGMVGSAPSGGWGANRNAGGEYQGALGANTGHRQLPDGSWEVDNSAYWQNQGYAPGQTAFTAQQPQVMPGTPSYTTPAPAAGSATAQNPFLNLGLNAFANTQGPYDPSWLNQFGQSLWNQANQNWADNINPSLNNASITAGGYGGDRAAIAKGVAADRLNQSVFNALAPAALQDYNAWQNRALQGGQAAASVGSGLEQLDLSRMLGIGGLQNAGRALDISQQNANTSTAAQAANSAGVPTYTNPLSAGVGGALGIAQLLNLIFGKG